MGMYDNVTCEVPLPDGYSGAFQTKDFDCCMDRITIRADGRLVHDKRAWTSHDAATATDLNFHGIFNFYDYTISRGWHEYEAKFTDGALVEIALASQEA